MHFEKQEQMVLAVLMQEVRLSDSQLFNCESWTELLLSIGFTHQDLVQWHYEFEKDSPNEHVAFLIALGMEKEDIERLRSELVGK